MRSYFVRPVFALFFISCFSVMAHAGSQRAVEQQDVAVTLAPENHLLTGESTITFAAGAGPVTLRLSTAASIESVTVHGKKVPYSFSGGTLA